MFKNNPDIRSLVFIARVGSIDDPQSCALLEWNRDLDHIGMFDNSWPERNQLTIDKCWEEETGGFVNPSMDHLLAINLDNSDPVQMMNESHHLTFHAIDVELYQAITVFNRTRFTDGEDGEEVFFEVDRHSTGSPRMYGLPPVGSPYFRILSDEELDQLDSDIDDSRGGGEIEGVMIDHNIDYMFLTGGLRSSER